MKTITYADIQALGPCYDSNKYIPQDYQGTLVDVLRMTNVSAKDRLWVVVRHTFMTDRELHLYGLSCARSAEKYSTDPRVKACNDVVERYIKGEATKEELSAAESAAESAWSAWSAAESAWSAAESARSAARSAAESAARSAAESAWSAAWSAAESARSARSARSAAEEQQCLELIKILEGQ